jgi:hypothetical protein
MKYFYLITLIPVLLINVNCSDPEKSQNVDSTALVNPFFIQDNRPIDFASITANHVSEAVVMTEKMTEEALIKIITIKRKTETLKTPYGLMMHSGRIIQPSPHPSI